ncbi:ABC transporter permease [Candidatus Magnetominusculus xianensis]|uniref:Multidrug ABC transporter substrate-binding protein n=1 Tax=Candidatus Magnetominusculus xianensis TaxID=1748249 RepID=A0ABR5SDB7_9BACT|nr:ABC transporter permease [Candidatus Magnetominusculus xianensis]KWT82936.1 multidrug ABC transporter substrate-binding protein [Candidatus Magnetominusculus xianensis]MBF0403015.1 ABC transporter permease [Nitrospirota bacterium]
MNRFANNIKSAAYAVLSFKLRTFFCLFSVSLGIASITVIVASVEGAYKKAYDFVEKFGPETILIFGGSAEQRANGEKMKALTLSDIKAIEEAFPTAILVVPMVMKWDSGVSYKNVKHKTLVLGSTEDYSRSWSWPIAEGSDLSHEDIVFGKNTCLIGMQVAETLFKGTSPIGKTILINTRIPCKVTGVLSDRSASQMGINLNDRIIIPIGVMMKKMLSDTKYISAIKIKYQQGHALQHWIAQMRLFLRDRHQLKEGQSDDFTIVSPEEIIKFLAALTGSLVVSLGISGIVSLVVSGFVLANLFLLSVKERTREIGIRRAVGAKKRDIFNQFIIESTLITSAGGVLGFMLGYGASKLLAHIADFPMHFSWKAFAIGFTLAVATGLVFGVQPARSAANLNPIEAIK